MCLLTAMTAAGASSVFAHHSFAAMYDADKPIRLVGKLTKIEWTNPHSFFYIDVTDTKGRVNSWTIEGAGPGALSRRGFNRGDIDLGDTLVVPGISREERRTDRRWAIGDVARWPHHQRRDRRRWRPWKYLPQRRLVAAAPTSRDRQL